MKLPRVALALAVLLALSASSARALEYWWERDLEFANKLAVPTRRYFDLAELVLSKLEKNPDIIGIQKAKLLDRIGDFYKENAATYGQGRNWREKMVEYLDKSRDYYQKFLATDAAQPGGKLADKAFLVRAGVSWLSLSLAEGEAKALDAEGLTKEAKEKIKDTVVKLFNATIEQIQKAIQDKDRVVQDLMAKQPKGAKEAEKWRGETLDPARIELFMIYNMHAQAEMRLAKFMRDAKFPDPKINELYKTVEKEFTDNRGGILFKFYTLGNVLPNAKLTLCHCLFEQGPIRDKDTEERIEDLWSRRADYSIKRIPCDVQSLRVRMFLRQKKYKDAQQAADDLLKYRTEVWGPEAKGPKASQAVQEILENFAGASVEDYDQRSIAAAILLDAEAFAGQAAEAAAAGKPPKAVEKLYGTAHKLAVGIRLARVAMDPKYATLMETWREKAKLPLAVPDRLILLDQAIRSREYGKAAGAMSDIIRDGGYPADKLYDCWMTVGNLYFNAKLYYEGYIVFWATARWFPNRDVDRACSLALTCLKKAKEEGKGTDAEAFNNTLYERAVRDIIAMRSIESPIPILDAKKLRGEGKFEEAIKKLKEIGPDTKFYAEALFETAQTRRAMAEKAYSQSKKGEATKAAGKACEDAFETLDAYYQKKLPALSEDVEKADDRKRLIQAATVGLVARCTALLEEFSNKPPKVIELTAPGFEKRYPGIEGTPYLGLALFYRERAAYLLVRADPDHADPNLAILEESWKNLTEKAKDFQYLDKAAATGAGAYGLVADRLDTLVKAAKDPAELKKINDPEIAKRLADPAEVKKMADRVAVLKNRSLEFYFQLIAANPKQPVNTYRFVIMTVFQRGRTEDFRKIIELAPPLIEELKDENDPTMILVTLQLKAILGISYAQITKFAEAVPILEEVDTSYEKTYQDALKRWTTTKEKIEELRAKKDLRAARMKVPDQPARPALQPDIKYWLGRSYLGGNLAPKYPAAVKLFTQLITIYTATSNVPKFWDAFYWYCEANAKMANYADAVGQINRVIIRDPNLHDTETKARFIQFLNRIKPEVSKDPKLRLQLEEILKILIGK